MSVIASGGAGSRQSNNVIRNLYLPIPWLCSPQTGFIPMLAVRVIGILWFTFSEINDCQKEYLFHGCLAKAPRLTLIGPIW